MDTIDPEDLEEISLSLADSNVGTEVTSDARPEERRRVEAILHRTIREFFSKTPLSSGAFSVTVDSTEFPPTLFERNAATLLRPVMIDACAVSNCFDQKYSSYWGKIRNTEMVSWHSCKVLRLKPIFKCLVHFLLLGHKVSILLPKYYRSSPCSEMRPKVDNVKAFNLLMNLNLLRFIEPEDPEKTDTIKGVVNRFDGLLVSSPACTDSGKEIPSQLSPSSNACNLPEHPSSTNVSERMATPIFFGRNHEAMCMMFDYQVNEGEGAATTSVRRSSTFIGFDL
ncbi:hypothetical protein KIN20_024225 [Parelaphostrongylus tenuis]|uniref:Zc3h12a-like Ribonuclease NYN domain-containing protein n=1 Tax=Parelaphostrongylus tenuis TaxID=148309 RepID=A0AAD5QW70_PARTN|nr:hypothetical protein KIN20_024225 [Parelaphostrongylus tenuis]